MARAATTTRADRHRPTTLDVARGLMFGQDPHVAPAPSPPTFPSPRRAFEDAVRTALERPPCLVAFSGGRDSSAVLAVAAALARREGLDPPIPVTFRLDAWPRADESAWQERVVAAAGLEHWERIGVAPGELGWLGPVATSVLRRDGLLYPATAFFFDPLARRASGGSLLTGHGGDELLADWRFAAAAGPGSRGRRAAGRALRLGYAATPPAVRALAFHESLAQTLAPRLGLDSPPLAWPWLRPRLARATNAEARREKAREPASWHARTLRQPRRRFLTATSWSMEVLAGHAGTTLVHPFLAPSFVAALAAAGGCHGLGTRTDMMRRLFGDCLPGALLARRSKAGYSDVFWDERSRRFAHGWDGGGVPRDLVDVDALRRVWSERHPTYRSALLLQAAWLAADAGS